MSTSSVDRLAGVSSSLAIKAPCDYYTTANITLSGLAVQAGGSWSSTLTQDDANPTRILVMHQTNPIDNGLWNPGAGTWTRCKDFDGARDVVRGTVVHVYQFDGDLWFEVSTANPIVIGTSEINFVASTAASILARLASTASAADGPGLINASHSLNYVAGTLGAKFNESVSVKDIPFLAKGDDATDDTAAIAAAITYLRGKGGGTLIFPRGAYRVTALDVYQGSAVPIRFVGEGKWSTVIKGTTDAVTVTHAEYFEVYDMSFVNISGTKKGTALATPTTKQAAHCRFERLNIENYRYGQWWRYSIWNTVKDVRWYNCGVGLKGSRNASPATSGSPTDNNPAAPGGWNADPGFFQNHNRFELCLADGCEAGVWGTFQNCYFDVTTQNGANSGAGNTVVPTSVPQTGVWLQNDGNGTSLLGARANQLSQYCEFVQQPLVIEYAGLVLSSFFAQGGGSSGAAYKQLVKNTGGSLNAEACDISAQDYFQNKVVLTSGATVIGNFTDNSATATVAADSVDSSSSYYKYTLGASSTTIWVIAGAGNQVVATAENNNTYEVTAVGLYDGSTVVSGRWMVAFWSSGFARIQADAGNSADIGLNLSGASIRVSTANALTYNMRATVLQHRRLSKFPYTG